MKVPKKLYRELREKGKTCDLVIVCRRGIVSKFEVWLLRLIIPRLKCNPLAPIFLYLGKIYGPNDRGNLVEILAEEKYEKICVLNRRAPFSRVRWREVIDYTRKTGEWETFIKFVIVGASGIAINLLFFYLLYGVLRVESVISLAIAIEISIIATYFLNERWVFPAKRYEISLIQRFAAYHAVLLIGMGINIGVYYPLSLLGINYMLSDLAGIGLASLWNFYMNNVYVFARRN